ncbi:MAG: alpha/beta fold hydrolase [Isosphaeraceae bacterium]
MPDCRAIEVIVHNERAGIRLAGTLGLPGEDGPYPALLLIPGSGKQDRDETVSGHRPFRVWADHLIGRGLAVLRLDDRGVGLSGGDKDQATHAELLEDLGAALDFLTARDDIDPRRLGVLGHSEGAILVAGLAATDSRVSLAVLLAGPGLAGDQVVLRQAETLSRAGGASEEEIAHERRMNTQAFQLARSDDEATAIRPRVVETIRRHLGSWPGGLEIGADEQEAQAEVMADVVLAPAFRSLLRADPSSALRQLRCPVLALNGQRDLQVEPETNLDAIRRALDAHRHPFTIVELVPGVNHLFQECATGRIEEYESIVEDVSSRVLSLVADWIAGCWGLA